MENINVLKVVDSGKERLMEMLQKKKNTLKKQKKNGWGIYLQ